MVELFPSRGVAQSGSASALGAEGCEFKSRRPDHSPLPKKLPLPGIRLPHLGEIYL